MKTIYRIRIKKNRFGVTNGPCFVGVHFGKRSLYIGKAKSRLKYVSLEGIKDEVGYVTVTTSHSNFYEV